MNNLKGGKAAYQIVDSPEIPFGNHGRMNIIETIGYQGPYISLLITSVALLDQKKYLGSFILFYCFQYYLIGPLKQILKGPRPKGYADKKNDDGGNYEGIELYGMPSGHSSDVWFCTIFLWLVKQSPYLLIIELVICFNTMYQRWSFKKHYNINNPRIEVNDFKGV